MEKYERAMKILDREYAMEMGCVETSYKLMKKAFNPIQRIKLWLSYRRFRDQAFGISLAIDHIKREIES